jgi:hypothetical protein
VHGRLQNSFCSVHPLQLQRKDTSKGLGPSPKLQGMFIAYASIASPRSVNGGPSAEAFGYVAVRTRNNS